MDVFITSSGCRINMNNIAYIDDSSNSKRKSYLLNMINGDELTIDNEQAESFIKAYDKASTFHQKDEALKFHRKA